MIVWLNGPFGAGKTTVAAALRPRLPGALAVDPEVIGWMIRRVRRVPTGDYQDLRLWRRLVVGQVAAIDRLRPGPVLVPMALLQERSTSEILGVLNARGHDLRHVLVDVSGEELHRRIAASAADAAGEGVRAWRRAQVAEYERERPRLLACADIVVDTTRLSPDEVATAVLVRLSN